MTYEANWFASQFYKFLLYYRGVYISLNRIYQNSCTILLHRIGTMPATLSRFDHLAVMLVTLAFPMLMVPLSSVAQHIQGYEYHTSGLRANSAGLHILGNSGFCGDHKSETWFNENVTWAPASSSLKAGFARVVGEQRLEADQCSPDSGADVGMSCAVCKCGPKSKPTPGAPGWCDNMGLGGSKIEKTLRFERPDVVKDQVITYTVDMQSNSCTCSSSATPVNAWGPFGPAQRAFSRAVFGAIHEKNVWKNCGNLVVGHLVNVTTSESYPRSGTSGKNAEIYAGSWIADGVKVKGSKFGIFGKQRVDGSFIAPSLALPFRDGGEAKLSKLLTYEGSFDGSFGLEHDSGGCIPDTTHVSRGVKGTVDSFRTVQSVDYTNFNLPDVCYSPETLQRCPKAPILKTFGSTFNF